MKIETQDELDEFFLTILWMHQEAKDKYGNSVLSDYMYTQLCETVRRIEIVINVKQLNNEIRNSM